jgi:hypothetical protein
MKKIVLVMVCLMFCSVSHAATVSLKNGSTVSGRIIERTADAVKLDVSGVTLTYYNDEIQTIDAGADAAPAPAGAPERVNTASTQEPVQPAAVEPTKAKPAAAVPAVAQPLMVEPATSAAVMVEPTLPKADPYAGLTKHELILKFIDAFGTRKSMQYNFEQIIQRLPSEQVGIFKNSFRIDEIINELAPLYDKRFSEEDLKAYIDFYSSPVGQKLVTAIPQIMNESVAISEKYFEANLPKDLSGAEPVKSDKN